MASGTNRRDPPARRLSNVKALLDELEQAARKVNPARLRAYLRGQGRRGKSDEPDVR